jgi:hypothetical protein
MVDFVEFLLWLDRTCMESVEERTLAALKRVLQAREAEGLDVAAAIRKEVRTGWKGRRSNLDPFCLYSDALLAVSSMRVILLSPMKWYTKADPPVCRQFNDSRMEAGTFVELARIYGLLYSAESLVACFDALVGGEESIDLGKLIRLIAPHTTAKPGGKVSHSVSARPRFIRSQ